MRSGFRNNSATPTVLTTSQDNHHTTAEEKGSIVQHPSKRMIHGRTYHSNPDSTYMLPRDDIEIDRLHEEHFVIKELLGFNIMVEALKLMDFQSGGLEVLDVCCGPATWLCETSLEYPNCRFSGIDMCSLWPQVIRPVNLDFTEANVLQGLPYPDRSFDFIQMRFVGLAFKTDEWPFVISEIKRVLKDGGCFQCVELDMRITTSDPIAQNYTETFETFCNSYGLDASIGAKLDFLLTEPNRSGEKMKILQSEYREIPLGWGGPIGEAYIRIFQGYLDGLSPWLKRFLQISDHQSYDLIMSKTKLALIQSKSFMGLYAFLVQKQSD
ncbi:S-adenosyl-L-methionine-dependent methyltransferase [Pilaira anomala]|nr:S-adenosyl-L-methionine-dependent methyltransferase [Pilaira anomala]